MAYARRQEGIDHLREIEGRVREGLAQRSQSARQLRRKQMMLRAQEFCEQYEAVLAKWEAAGSPREEEFDPFSDRPSKPTPPVYVNLCSAQNRLHHCLESIRQFDKDNGFDFGDPGDALRRGQ